MDMILMKERLKPYKNEGFNCKDRKTTKMGKVWSKADKSKPDIETFSKKLEV